MPVPKSGNVRSLNHGGMPTVHDVGEAAGVTAAVVSRVLNGDETLRVRPETRARVIAAAKALDYTPNTSARALRLASSSAICLVVTDIANPIHAATLQGAQASAARSERVVLLADGEEFIANGDRLRTMVDSRRVDGFVIHLSGAKGDRSLHRLLAPRLPTVVMNSRVGGLAGSVSLDDAAGAQLATEHLLELGHERIAMVTGVAGSDRSQRREQGVIKALADRGLSLPTEWLVEGGFAASLGHTAGARLLCGRRRPVVVANVMAAIGVLAAARDLGIVVPTELSVVALLDTWFCEHTAPPLTVVDLPIREMGEAAVDLLVRMIGGKPRESIVLRDPPPRLIVRRSTAPPA